MTALRSTFLHAVLLVLLIASQGAAAQANSTAQDTLNRMDGAGQKQGWWKIAAPVADKPGYTDGQLVEEGRYANSKRMGTWKRYWPNGKLMSEINYTMGRPKGDYTTYYPDGKTEEKGTWDLDRNTGTFKRWHTNGQLAQDFVFNQYGVRDGMQKYYHENGQLEVAVKVVEGKEDGTLKRYYANGDLQQVAEFNDGVINASNSKYIKAVHKVDEPKPDADAKPAPARTEEQVTNAVIFRANGYNTLYDKQMRLAQQGQYVDGKLRDGKVYYYNKAGVLSRVDIYIGGRYAGQGVLTDDDKK